MFYKIPLKSVFTLVGVFDMDCVATAADSFDTDPKIDALLNQMALDEKFGQIVQANMMAVTSSANPCFTMGSV